MGDRIEAIYSKAGSIYAVYGTPKGVKVQFADNSDLMLEQRRALSPLHPLRGQIEGLLDGWRTSKRPGTRARVGIFDRRTAGALTVALQGDQAHAESLLKNVRDDIVEEQESMGRASYLAVATACALAVFLFFTLISVNKAAYVPPAGVLGLSKTYFEAAANTLASTSSFIVMNKIPLAAGFGALGALFSIAISIRKRAIRPDMQRRDNVIDAILRIMIGVVSAVILFSLLRSQLVTLSFGAKQANFGTGGPEEMHGAIVIAFVAGFAEMLVGDYLTRAVIKEPASSQAGAAAQQAAQRETEANELNPRGRKELTQPPADGPAGVATPAANLPAAPAAALWSGAHDHEAGLDGCLCGTPVADDDLTGDVELPPATGGIAKIA